MRYCHHIDQRCHKIPLCNIDGTSAATKRCRCSILNQCEVEQYCIYGECVNFPKCKRGHGLRGISIIEKKCVCRKKDDKCKVIITTKHEFQ